MHNINEANVQYYFIIIIKRIFVFLLWAVYPIPYPVGYVPKPKRSNFSPTKTKEKY